MMTDSQVEERDERQMLDLEVGSLGGRVGGNFHWVEKDKHINPGHGDLVTPCKVRLEGSRSRRRLTAMLLFVFLSLKFPSRC